MIFLIIGFWFLLENREFKVFHIDDSNKTIEFELDQFRLIAEGLVNLIALFIVAQRHPWQVLAHGQAIEIVTRYNSKVLADLLSGQVFGVPQAGPEQRLYWLPSFQHSYRALVLYAWAW